VSKRELKPDLAYQKAFGKHVKKLRESVGWTQLDLAVHSRVSEYQISVIENGHEGPNFQTLLAISLALGKYPAELFDFAHALKVNSTFPKDKHKPKSTVAIRKLIDEGFFKKMKQVSEVVEAVKENTKSSSVRSSEISGILLRLVNEGTVKLIKKDSKNFYKV